MSTVFQVGPDFTRAVEAFAILARLSGGDIVHRAINVRVSRDQSWAWGRLDPCETYAEFSVQGLEVGKVVDFSVDSILLSNALSFIRGGTAMLDVRETGVYLRYDNRQNYLPKINMEGNKWVKPTRDTTTPMFSSEFQDFHRCMTFIKPVLSLDIQWQNLWFKYGRAFTSQESYALSYGFPPCADHPFAVSTVDALKIIAYLGVHADSTSVFAYLDALNRNFLYISVTGADFKSYLKIPVLLEVQEVEDPVSVMGKTGAQVEFSVDSHTLVAGFPFLLKFCVDGVLHVDAWQGQGKLEIADPALYLSVKDSQSGEPNYDVVPTLGAKSFSALKAFFVNIKVFTNLVRDMQNDNGLYFSIHNAQDMRSMIIRDTDKKHQALLILPRIPGK